MQFDNWLSQLHPDDRAWVLEEFERQTAAGDVVQLPEYRIRSSAGEERWILSKGAVASRDAHGRVKSYFGLDFDITRRKETERRLSLTKEKLESRLEEIEVLRKAGSIITSTLDAEEVVRHVLEQARRMVPYETATVMELDGSVLRIINGRGWTQGDEIRGLELPYPGRNPTTMVMRNGKPLFIHEPTRYYPLFRILGIDDVRSWMGVPLIVQGRIIGMITFDSRVPHAFTFNHMRLGGMLAEHIAVAIHKPQSGSAARYTPISRNGSGFH